MVSVRWSVDAVRDLEDIEEMTSRRIVEKTQWLEENFSTISPERLRRDFKNSYKLRIGDYRVIYSVRSDVIVIEKVGHRRDVYK